MPRNAGTQQTAQARVAPPNGPALQPRLAPNQTPPTKPLPVPGQPNGAWPATAQSSGMPTGGEQQPGRRPAVPVWDPPAAPGRSGPEGAPWPGREARSGEAAADRPSGRSTRGRLGPDCPQIRPMAPSGNGSGTAVAPSPANGRPEDLRSPTRTPLTPMSCHPRTEVIPGVAPPLPRSRQKAVSRLGVSSAALASPETYAALRRLRTQGAPCRSGTSSAALRRLRNTATPRHSVRTSPLIPDNRPARAGCRHPRRHPVAQGQGCCRQ